MALPPILLLIIGLPMLLVGVSLVVRFFQRNRLDERPIEPKPQGAQGPVWTQNALLGALMISIGALLTAFGIAALVAGPGT